MKSSSTWVCANGQAGSSLVETLVSTSIAAISIAGLCVANANCLGIVRAHREMLVADQCLQQRIELFRSANWSQVTDASSASTVLNTPSANDGSLNGQTEMITISPYPPVQPAVVPIALIRNTDGTIGTLSFPPPGFSLRSAVAVRVDLQEAWVSAQGGRRRVRSASTVVALGGLLDGSPP